MSINANIIVVELTPMRDESGSKTKGFIGLALYYLLLKKPYENISVKDICEKAGVSRMSFYRYYRGKDEIFLDYCDQRFEEFYSEFSKKENPTIRDFLIDTFHYITKHQKQLKVINLAGKNQLLLTQFDSYTTYLIKNIFYAKESNPIIGHFLAGGIFNVITCWVDKGMRETPEELADYILDIVTKKGLTSI